MTDIEKQINGQLSQEALLELQTYGFLKKDAAQAQKDAYKNPLKHQYPISDSDALFGKGFM